MFLLVVINARVIVALGTLKVCPQKQPANIAHQQVGIQFTVQYKTGCRPSFLIGAIYCENFPHGGIEWTIFDQTVDQPVSPSLDLHIFAGSSLHPPGIQHAGPVPSMLRTGQKLVDSLLPFGRVFVSNKGTGLIR